MLSTHFKLAFLLFTVSAISTLAQASDSILGATLRWCVSSKEDADCFERQPFDSKCIAAKYQVGEGEAQRYRDKDSTIQVSVPLFSFPVLTQNLTYQ